MDNKCNHTVRDTMPDPHNVVHFPRIARHEHERVLTGGKKLDAHERADLFFVRPKRSGQKSVYPRLGLVDVVVLPDGRRGHLLDREAYEAALRAATEQHTIKGESVERAKFGKRRAHVSVD